MSAVKTAIDAFGDTSGDADDLQSKLSQWQTKNFGKADLSLLVLGVCEEAGELCHAVLKNSQGIRGFSSHEKFLESAGDAIADCMIFLIQCCTALGMSSSTLLREVSSEVMKRDWTKNREVSSEVMNSDLAKNNVMARCSICGFISGPYKEKDASSALSAHLKKHTPPAQWDGEWLDPTEDL